MLSTAEERHTLVSVQTMYNKWIIRLVTCHCVTKHLVMSKEGQTTQPWHLCKGYQSNVQTGGRYLLSILPEVPTVLTNILATFNKFSGKLTKKDLPILGVMF